MINFQSMTASYKNTDIDATRKTSYPINIFANLPDMRSEFGQRLYDARKLAKLTQVQLSEAVGMSQAAISELEKIGQGSALTPAIAEKCGVSVNWLAYGTGDMLAKEQAKPASTLSQNAMALALMYDNLPNDAALRTKRMRAAIDALLGIERPTSSQQKAAAPPAVSKEKRHA